ncbi:MAG: hypothetical protein DRN12_08025 [Thermoplasmata archaeon]|nr:MAG: hypothetical protein DRN12_08025 [Thermoplasmata archaeon]
MPWITSKSEEEYEKALRAVETGEQEGKIHLVNLLAAVMNIVALIGIKHVVLGGPYSKLLGLNDMLEMEKRVWETCREHDATIAFARFLVLCARFLCNRSWVFFQCFSFRIV